MEESCLRHRSLWEGEGGVMFDDVAVMVRLWAGIGVLGIHVASNPCQKRYLEGKYMKLRPLPGIVISTDNSLDLPRVGRCFIHILHPQSFCTNDPSSSGRWGSVRVPVPFRLLRRLTASRITTPTSPPPPLSSRTVESPDYIAA